MKLTKHQQICIYLNTVESATIEQIYENVSFGYYCNAHKHLGNVLRTMLKQGKVERVSKGVYRIAVSKRVALKQYTVVLENPNQLKIE